MIFNFDNIKEQSKNLNQNKTINEAYFGETKEIKEMLKCINSFRRKHMGNYYFNGNLSVDPDILKFNRLVEDFWGFHRFALILKPGIEMNAMTMPLGYRLDYSSKRNNNSKRGFKYNKEDGYTTIVWIYSGLILNDIFTDREVLAILLHEIGHNFEATIDSLASVYYNVSKILLLPSILLNLIIMPSQGFGMHNKSYEWYINTIEEMKKKKSPFTEILSSIDSIKSITGRVFYNINIIALLLNPLAVISSTASTMARQLQQLITNLHMQFKLILYGQKGEIISDAFASMYGFESDLVTGFNKIENNAAGNDILAMINKDPIFGLYAWMLLTPQILIQRVFDEHPSNAHRYRQQLIFLRREIEKEDIDPKLKRELEIRMDVLEKNIDNALKINEDYYGTAINKTLSKINYYCISNGLGGKYNDNKMMKLYDKIDKALERE